MKNLLVKWVWPLRFFALALVLVAFWVSLRQYLIEQQTPAETTAYVKNFALLDHQGVFHELQKYSDQKAIVLISQGNGCPIIRKSVPYINELVSAYARRGVVFFMFNANLQDDRASIVQEAVDFNITVPVLEDTAQIVSKALGVSRTAEAILINAQDLSIIYRGAIHDKLGYGSERKDIKRHYLRKALDEFLNGQPVVVKETQAKGCLINIEDVTGSNRISFTQNVAPVLISKCVPCHSPGGVAPWSMDSYQKVKGWGPMVAEVVRTRRMPPWHADSNYGEFKDDISLSSHEIRVILEWVNQNYVRGEGEDPLIERRTSSREWGLGDPDLIFQLASVQEVPATGGDEFRFIEADRLVDKDIWIKAIEIKPGNPKVVHHANLAIEPPESGADEQPSRDEQWAQMGGLHMERGMVIAGYAPGSGPFKMPLDTGIFVPKGSKLVFRTHYITTGRRETDLSKVGIYLHEARPSQRLLISTINNRDIQIAPGESNYKRGGEFTFDSDALLTALQPHMHYRGKSMRFTIHYPDGSSEIALSVPNYRFHWQRRYEFVRPKFIPKGTRVILEGYFDNSYKNPDNPDPKQQVVYGPFSHTEMFQGILYYVEVKNRPGVEVND